MSAELQSRMFQLQNHATALHDGAFNSFIRKMEEGEGRIYTPEERAKIKSVMIDPSSFEIHIPKERTLDILGNAKPIMPLIHDMSWSVVEPERGFVISSDNPVCRVVIGPRHPMSDGGFLHKNVEVSFPLSPKRLLLMSWHKGLPPTFEVSRQFIDVSAHLLSLEAEAPNRKICEGRGVDLWLFIEFVYLPNNPINY